jgi:hypothetical protein
MKRSQRTSSHLLDLPSDLRNNIYELVFEGTAIDIWRKQPLTSVLKVNKQLYNETVKVLY